MHLCKRARFCAFLHVFVLFCAFLCIFSYHRKAQICAEFCKNVQKALLCSTPSSYTPFWRVTDGKMALKVRPKVSPETGIGPMDGSSQCNGCERGTMQSVLHSFPLSGKPAVKSLLARTLTTHTPLIKGVEVHPLIRGRQTCNN